MSTHVCTLKELVDGKVAAPSDELAAVLTDSDTGEVLHAQRASTPDQVDAAIAVAASVHAAGTWSDLPVADRVAAIRRLMVELAARAEDLARADSLDSGVSFALTSALIGARIGLLEVGAAQLEAGFGHEVVETSVGGVDRWRLPWGPAAVLTPWNAPTPTAIMKVGDALVAGCPVILKPSEWAPHFSGPFAEAVEAADLPHGVVQLLHGGAAVGAQLVGDPRIAAVSYTGGVQGGTAVAEACARQLKPFDGELSGNNPVVALPSADPTAVAVGVLSGMLMLNGQICSGPRRLVVPADQLEVYVATLGAMLDTVVLGATDDATAAMGPLAHPGHQASLEARLEGFAERGCTVSRHGTLPELGGHFFAPAIVRADAAPDLRDEVFGPVVVVRSYTDVEEAVAIANDHAYGLTAYVFSADRDEARAVGRRLRAGLVTINAVYGGQTEVPAEGDLWGASGLGQLGIGTGPAFWSGQRFVG